MKKIFTTLFLTLALIISAIGFTACGGSSDNDSEIGLIVKKYRGEDFYTVTGYVDDGKTTVLDLTSKDGTPVGRIAEGAFDGVSSLYEIIVPDTVTEIGKGAFKNVKNLNKLTLPFIGKNANADAYPNQTASSSIKCVDSERTIAYLFGDEEYDGGVKTTNYYNSESSSVCYIPATLSTVAINPKEDYSVPMFALSGVKVLRTVELSNKIIAIGCSAFNGCSNLSTIKIPASVTDIYEGAFNGCTNLKNLSFDENCKVEQFGEKAFYGITLTEFVVPNSVKTIGKECFATSSLKKINLNQVETVKYGAFSNCESLTEVATSKTTVNLEYYAFYKCAKLTDSGINKNCFVFDKCAFVESGVTVK